MMRSISFWYSVAITLLVTTMVRDLAGTLAYGIICCLLILMRVAAQQEGAKALAGRLIDSPRCGACFKSSGDTP